MAATEVLRNDRSWIQKSPEVCGGDACIRTTRIPVWSVIAALRLGVSENQLRAYFTTPLTDADIQAALTYHEQHASEIDEAIVENERA